MIEIRELTKYYGESKAVGPLNVSIDKGEVVGLLGLNGAGKTTALRMLATDLLPTSGTMRVDGIDLVDQPERVRPRIGYLPDRPPLYGEMDVREFLVFAARLRKMERARIEKRVDEVLEMTSLTPQADQAIGTLSHGYRQRVGIAQAIVHQPNLLLLDEPISGLDPVQIVEMRALIRSLKGEYTTVLSSHILSEISETCDRILVIRDGEIVATGTEAELAAQMQSVAVQHLVAITVRVDEAHRHNPADRIRKILVDLPVVDAVVEQPGPDLPPGVCSLQLSTREDVREELVKKLVGEGIGILELRGSARELEAVFLELAGRGHPDRGGPNKEAS